MRYAVARALLVADASGIPEPASRSVEPAPARAAALAEAAARQTALYEALLG
jgi:hypothetical protein